MKKLNKKGFTLTEMIVVIAIIGILAAVLIPSVIGYVRHARKSNDTQVAASMTDELERYCIENNIDQDLLIGTDVRTILKAKGYNLVPSSDNWTYVYNAEEKVVEIVSLSLKGEVKLDAFTPVDPTNIAEQMYLVGEGDSAIEKAVKLLINYNSESDYFNAISLVKDLSYISLLEQFNPTDTLYLNNISCLSSPDSVTKIVFTTGTYNIPNFIQVKLSNDIEFFIPQTVSSISEYTEKMYGDKFTNISLLKNNYRYQLIDLSSFDISINEDGELVNEENSLTNEFVFGELVTGSTSQSISISVIGYKLNMIDEDGDGKYDENGGVLLREIQLVYEVTIIYFGEEGIVAKGSKTVLSAPINEDYVYDILENYQRVDI